MSKLGLPAGLFVAPNGFIEGLPTTAGIYNVLVTVTDSSAATEQATAAYTITVKPPPLSQDQTVGQLVAGVNVAFNFALAASGGQVPLTWSESGALPTGFSLSAGGVLSGTPLVTGTFPITVNVRDSAGQSSSHALTVVVTPHGFAMTGAMITPRSSHTATLLNDGTVLIAGGNDNAFALWLCELYSPGSASFTQTGSLSTARYSHTATLLGTGQVLVAGGNDSNATALASAELYDPNNNAFTSVGNMASPRDAFTATLLANGKVLLAGGGTVSPYGSIAGMQATAELFDPSTQSFSVTGSMSTPRAAHTATRLGNGKVLIAGGLTADSSAGASAELYDPSSGKFMPTGSMHVSRYAHTATLLANGTVLVTGGISVTPDQAVNTMLASAEIYDPSSGSFSTTGSMATGRASHAAGLLGDGSVLVDGGIDQNADPLFSAEVYSPGAGQFSLTGGMQVRRDAHTATVLGTGGVLVSGGNNAAGSNIVIDVAGVATGAISTAEIYK